MKVKVLVYLFGATVLEVASKTAAMGLGCAIPAILLMYGPKMLRWIKRRA